MRKSRIEKAWWFLPVFLLTVGACVTVPGRLQSNVLDFIYPEGSKENLAQAVTLELPVRVGVAFAPLTRVGHSIGFLNEVQRQELLTRIAEAFEGHDGIEGIDVIPSTYLKPGGGFDNLDRLQAAFGTDLLALIGVDQMQFTETGGASWTYLTIVGAYVVKGERNEIHTVLETAVFDISSRALLFRASGANTVKKRSTPVGTGRTRRLLSEEGFSQATDDLIEQLGGALEAFEEQAATGTVRGVGTPAIRMVDASGAEVIPGGGALGTAELVLIVLLVGTVFLGRRHRHG